MALEVTTPRFEHGEMIPEKYTCDGDNVSPALSWENLPKDTVSVVLLVDDPDAPGGVFTHWIVYNLPGDNSQLEEIVPKSKNLDNGGIQGRNDFGEYGYGGPCPPQGENHHYYFRVFALDKKLEPEDGTNRNTLLQAIEGNILDEGEYMGRYKRK